METKELKEYVPGLAGVPAVKSRISFIDGFQGLLAYRGIPIEQLARQSTFAETSFLLLYGALPRPAQLASWEKDLSDHRRLSDPAKALLQALPAEGHPMRALQSASASLG